MKICFPFSLCVRVLFTVCAVSLIVLIALLFSQSGGCAIGNGQLYSPTGGNVGPNALAHCPYQDFVAGVVVNQTRILQTPFVGKMFLEVYLPNSLQYCSYAQRTLSSAPEDHAAIEKVGLQLHSEKCDLSFHSISRRQRL